MQVTSLMSRREAAHKHEHDHGHDHDHHHHDDEHGEGCSCGHDHEHAPVKLWQTIFGIVFVFNAFLVARKSRATVHCFWTS